MDIVLNQTASPAREYLSPAAKAFEEELLAELNVLPADQDPNHRYLNVLVNDFPLGGLSIQDLVRNAARNYVSNRGGDGLAAVKRIITILNGIGANDFKRTTPVGGLRLEFRCAARKGATSEQTQQVLPTLESLFG